PDGTRVSSFTVHPSGQLSVLAMQPESGGAGCGTSDCPMTIVRLSGAGDTLREHVLEDAGHPGEAIAYDLMGQPVPFDLPPDHRPRFGPLSHALAVADGEGLYLVAWSIGDKLYRIDPDDRERWSVQLMPANVGMAFFPAEERIAFDEQGNVFVT